MDFETCDLHTLRIDARHHMLDDTVFPRRIHCLDDDQHAIRILSVENALEFLKHADVFVQFVFRILLLFELTGKAAIVVLEGETFSGFCGERGVIHGDSTLGNEEKWDMAH